MTEDEAKGKWCPFARSAMVIKDHQLNPIQIASANRFQDDKLSPCLGSECMAWRTTAADVVVTVPDLGKHYPPKETKTILNGYCGLAGKP